MTLAIPVRVLLLLAGTASWVLLWGSLTAANVVSGIGVSSIPLLADRRHGAWRRAVRVRPLAFVAYCLHVAGLALAGTARVAWEVVTPRRHGEAGEVVVPYGSLTDGQLTLLVGSITVTPGTFVVDVDHTSRCLTVHALQLRDPDAAARDVLALRDRIVAILPSAPSGEVAT